MSLAGTDTSKLDGLAAVLSLPGQHLCQTSLMYALAASGQACAAVLSLISLTCVHEGRRTSPWGYAAGSLRAAAYAVAPAAAAAACVLPWRQGIKALHGLHEGV